MFLLLWTILAHSSECNGYYQPSSCSFNSMCTCTTDPNSKSILDASCVSVPFYKFPNLTNRIISHLEIVDTELASLESEGFAGTQVQSLTLSKNALQYVPSKAFGGSLESLTSLDLGYNNLDSIPFEALKDLRNLQWLSLHSNQICSVVGDWSQLKSTLSTLFLSENDIMEIPSEFEDNRIETVHGLKQFDSLIWLNLDGNMISGINKLSLPPTLQTISVSYNVIREFPLEVVSGLPHLQWLYLRGNYIKTIPEYTFSKRQWIEKIDLGENHLTTFPRKPFNNSIYIRDLNLAFNDIHVLTAESFSGLQCGRIILSHNQLETIEHDAFDGIKDTLEYLDFDHNRFSQIPTAIAGLKSLKFLYLSSNNISEIPEGIFDNFCSSLKALSLSGNGFSSVPSESLYNCTKLAHFNIAFNEIFELMEGDFANWGSNIRSLVMGNNRLSALQARVFQELSELRELCLSFNPLRYLDPAAFEGLTKLESLELSFALDGDYLPLEIFKPLKNLKWLSLDNNNLYSLASSTFDFLQELIYLNLESNQLRVVPVGLFKSSVMAKLKDLRLSYNELRAIQADAFISLSSLETLLLSDNEIRSIQSGSFRNLSRLHTIVLSNNVLSEIDFDAFVDLPACSKLDLQNNLLRKFSLRHFTNFSKPLHLNLSRNEISHCNADSRKLNVEVLDLRFNRFGNIPECLGNIERLNKLFLDNNFIPDLQQNSFKNLTVLQHLTLTYNRIVRIHKNTFFGLRSLEVLDLSQNMITHLQTGLFEYSPKLRVLKLAYNNLKFLPKEIFSNTMLEMLDLTQNSFSVIPSSSLSEVGITLRRFSISLNNVDHIDSTVFLDVPFLQHLDLSNNKFTILPDNVFTSLGLLQKLDLSSNPLRANFKELFHYAQKLKDLNLANTGIIHIPHLPLPQLIHLNLSHNQISTISKSSFQELQRLKYLDISCNQLKQIPSQLWSHLPLLKHLDLSGNPIKEILKDDFEDLISLQSVQLLNLNHLQKFEPDALIRLPVLTTLTIQTWPSITNYREKFCNLLMNLKTLKILKITIEESTLDNQLMCVTSRKIRQLEISGKGLRTIARDAFVKFARNPELTLTISNTAVEELPASLFSSMYKVSHLSINLKNNMLAYLSPEVFYGDSSTWKSVGTTLISGGLFLSGNPFKCGCHLAWLGHWLRRWMQESLQSHNVPVDMAIRLNDVVKEATCTDASSGAKVAIVRLPPKDLSCHASALSAGTNLNQFSVMLVVFRCVVVGAVVVLRG